MGDPTIFKATYSAVPVYEMMCKGVAVMRRRSDAWLNATQILKVAGFDKPQRTRILERDVQKAEHEKVQGGYGKYQGTWVPLDRGLALAKQYNIEPLLRPIIDYEPTSASPPLAPKHVTAIPVRVKRGNGEGSSMATRGSRRHAVDSDESRPSSPVNSVGSSHASSPSRASSSSRTPSPIRSSDYESEAVMGSVTRQSARKRKLAATEPESKIRRPERVGSPVNDPTRYGDIILDYFISDTNTIPSILVNPPIDFDPNMALDDDGHTPLHWACAMGRTRVVKLLLTAGADIYKINKQGQTALMRSVMFGNNYDVRKFPELYELLHRSTLNIDNSNRTVFHHIIGVAMGKGNPHAARYYMETLLGRLSDFPQELADIINFQDEEGETALTMAARCRSKRLVKLLIDHGADPKIKNRDGKTCEDYILEDERFRSSPNSRAIQLRTMPATSSLPVPRTYHSDIARKAGGKAVADATTLLEGLAEAYDKELMDQERDLTQARYVLGSLQAEIAENHKALQAQRETSVLYDEAKAELESLENEMLAKLEGSYRVAWQEWMQDDTPIRPTSSNGNMKSTDDPMDGTHALDASDLDQIEEYYRAPDHQQNTDEIGTECEALRQEIVEQQRRRQEMFKQYIKDQSEAGTGGRMQDYRRLIAAGMGGTIQPSKVDEIVDALLEVLETEETPIINGNAAH